MAVLLDDNLDELEELRGDLPNLVNKLVDQITSLKEEINSKETEQTESFKKRDSNEDEVEKHKENQKKFKSLQNQEYAG